MNFKRYFALIVAVLMLVSLFAGCTSDNSGTSGNEAGKGSSDTNTDEGKGDKEDTEKKEIKTFTMYMGDSNAKPIDLFETPVGKKVTELTGVKLEIEYLVGSDEETKAGLMIASGDYPDFIFPHNESGKFLDAQALIPIEDYIEQFGVNTKKAYGKDLKKLVQDDGHTYWLAWGRGKPTTLYIDMGFWLPVDLLRGAGWPKVTEFEQYFNLIKDYVRKNPEIDGKPTIGYTILTDSWRIFTLQLAGAHLAGSPNDGGVFVNDKYEAEWVGDKEYTNRYLKKLNELWLEGLVDKETFSQNYDQYKAKIATGRVVGFFDHRWQIQDAINALEQAGMFDRVPVAMPVLYEGVKRDCYMFTPAMTASQGIAISKNCKDPEGAFKFLDQMLSEEVQRVVHWGIEGQDYEVKDGRYALTTPKMIEQLDDEDYMNQQGRGRFYFFPQWKTGLDKTWSDGTHIDPKDSPEYLSTKYKDYEKDILKQYGVEYFSQLAAPPFESPYGLGWDVSIPDGHPAQIASQQADDIQRQYLPKLIMADKGKFEDMWNEYIEQLKNIDIKAFEDFRTKAYQERVKKWNE